MKSKKKVPEKPIKKKPAAKEKAGVRTMTVADKEKEYEDQEEELPEEEEDEEYEEDDMPEQDQQQQSSSTYQESSSGGGGDQQEKNLVLGHIVDPKTGFIFYKREEVRKDLIGEVVAQEKYEDKDYDSRIEAAQENKKKAEEALSNMKYDPDKLREEAEKANKEASDPKQAEAQAKEIQKLREKLYPQPPGAGAGK